MNRISATIITLNEESDLPQCLESLSWVDEIIVVDSGSTDGTVDIARRAGAHVYQEPWRGYGAQKNYAMSLCKGQWILNIDADEVVTAELKNEILAEIQSSRAASGYQVARKTFYLGRWIRYGGWYPNYVTRLCRAQMAQWTEPHVHEELKVQGELRRLKHPLLHYTFSDISDQIRTNMKYASQGAQALKSRGGSQSLIKLLLKPLGKFLECYIFKRGFLDGLPGFIIAINAAHSMFLKFAYLLELDLQENQKPHQFKDEKQLLRNL